MSKQTQAYLYAGSAVLMWSTVATAFKVSLRYLDVAQLVFYATLVSVLVMFMIVLIQGKLHLLRTYTRTQYLRSAALGLLNPFIYYLALFKAYDLLPAQEVQPLNYTWPIIVTLMSIPVLKQRIGRLGILSVLVSFLGVFIISTRGDILGFRFSDPIGSTLALGTAFMWATYWLANLKDDRDEVTKLFLNFVFGLVFVTAFTVTTSDIFAVDLLGIGGAAYAGVFEMGLAFVLWLKGLSLSRTTAQVANLIYLTPFVSLLLINRIVGEEIFTSTIVGLTLIVVGLIISRFGSRVTEGT